jgi:uncharacterized repeat protein (TIGR04138 family)
LLRALCDHAKQTYGLLAWTVIESWGVTSAGHVGRIVYQLIEVGVLAKQDSDRYEDFEAEWDLREILERRYFD